jgi:hypothetical protein
MENVCLPAPALTSRSTPGIRSRCQRHTHNSHTFLYSQTPPASVEVCECLVSFDPLCRLYLRCQHAGASTSDTLRSRWAGKGRCICRAHTQRGELPCHKQVPLSCVVQLSTSLASMAVDEKAFAIHSMHKVALGGEGDRRGSTRHPSLKSHWQWVALCIYDGCYDVASSVGGHPPMTQLKFHYKNTWCEPSQYLAHEPTSENQNIKQG